MIEPIWYISNWYSPPSLNTIQDRASIQYNRAYRCLSFKSSLRNESISPDWHQALGTWRPWPSSSSWGFPSRRRSSSYGLPWPPETRPPGWYRPGRSPSRPLRRRWNEPKNIFWRQAMRVRTELSLSLRNLILIPNYMAYNSMLQKS